MGFAPRLIHGEGRTYLATFSGATVVPWLADVPLFRDGRSRRAAVRWSRFLDTPLAVPEVRTLAIKIYGDGDEVDQDFMFFSTFSRLPLHAVPWPRRNTAGTLFSTAMSYRVADRWVVFGVRTPELDPELEREPEQELEPGVDGADDVPWPLDELDRLVAQDDFTLDVVTATPNGRWWLAGVLADFEAHDPANEAIRFRPGQRWPQLGLSRLGQFRDTVYRALQAS